MSWKVGGFLGLLGHSKVLETKKSLKFLVIIIPLFEPNSATHTYSIYCLGGIGRRTFDQSGPGLLVIGALSSHCRVAQLSLPSL